MREEREERIWIWIWILTFYSSEASKPVKLLLGCVLGRRDGAGSGGLSAVLTGRTCLQGFELPLQISINSTKTKRRSKENDDMVSDREIIFERSVCAADHWVSFISHVCMYVCTSNISVPTYIHAFVCFDKKQHVKSSINVCVYCMQRVLVRSVRCAISSIPQTQSSRNHSSSSCRIRILHLASGRWCSSGQQASIGRETVSPDQLRVRIQQSVHLLVVERRCC
jgi:hypothetical protein